MVDQQMQQPGPIDEGFVYPPLQDPSNEIRLLRYGPKIGDQISCYMTVHTLEEAEDTYTAISYTWGDPTRLKQLQINRSPFLLTSNGEFALRQVRWHQTCVYVWIDAICIDQSNDDERGHQVRNMGRIYSKASYVAACVGSGTNAISLGSENRLLSRPGWRAQAKAYFSRMWIVQELVLARQIVVMQGESCEAGDDFLARYSWDPSRRQLIAKRKLFRSAMFASRPANLLGQETSTSQERDDRRSPSLADAIVMYAGGSRRDPRDQIYSLIGLTDHVDRGRGFYGLVVSTPGHFPVSYLKSFLEVFFDFVSHLSNLHSLSVAAQTISKLIDLLSINWTDSRIQEKVSSEIKRVRQLHISKHLVVASQSLASQDISPTGKGVKANFSLMSCEIGNPLELIGSGQIIKHEAYLEFDGLRMLAEDFYEFRSKHLRIGYLREPYNFGLLPKQSTTLADSIELRRIVDFVNSSRTQLELYLHPLDLLLSKLGERFDLNKVDSPCTGLSYAIARASSPIRSSLPLLTGTIPATLKR